MKKNLSQSLNKLPIIIIAIDINKQITFYNNVAKQKFLFIEEKIDINNVIRSSELNKFIEEKKLSQPSQIKTCGSTFKNFNNKKQIKNKKDL